MAQRVKFDVGRHLPSTIFVVVVALLAAGVTGAMIYAGVYNIAADAPHTKPVFWAIQNLRDRSIAVRSGDIKPPPISAIRSGSPRAPRSTPKCAAAATSRLGWRRPR